jgi:isopentenyl phosphate kinase
LTPISIPPSAGVHTKNREIVSWNLQPIERAISTGLLPVTYGDVVFDETMGGTILSTEDLFIYLARRLKPKRILLAGHEPGVWQDFPTRSEIISEITPSTAKEMTAKILGADESDVTGGMDTKVMNMLDLVQSMPEIEVNILSGLDPGNIMKAILGERIGTSICADQ